MCEVDKKTFDNMIDNGFTEKMIYHYFGYIHSEREDNFPDGYMEWAHAHGFIAGHALVLGINEKNYHDFISDYDFYRTFPHNCWLKLWINDKLTLKYMLQGTEWSGYMPEYYYYYVPGIGLRNLVDNKLDVQGVESFITILKNKKELACKPNNGTESVGFHHMKYQDNLFYLDNKLQSENEIKTFVCSKPNYLYTEYLKPGNGLEKIHEKIHTIRVVVTNTNGDNPKIVGGYIRFPVNCLGEANYSKNFEEDDFLYYVPFKYETGECGMPVAIYADRTEIMAVHPDSKFDFSQGFTIPNWDLIVRTVKDISKYLVGTELLGFDIGITESGMKIMEINSLPGAMGCQFSEHINNTGEFANYIRNKLSILDSISVEDRRKRRYIV